MLTDTNDSTVIGCSLTDAELREWRARQRKVLLPNLVHCRLDGCVLTLEFTNSKTLRSEVEEFAELERQCCGFLTFTITPLGENLVLKIEGPKGAQSTLQGFAEAVSGKSPDLVVPFAKERSTLEKKLRQTSLTGIAVGIVALVACELPIVLTLLGLSTLGASVSVLKPPFWVEVIGTVFAVSGLLLLSILAVRRWRIHHKGAKNENRCGCEEVRSPSTYD